ncbi:MAG: hpxO [Actinomycetia bacterium]|nr:hpxO [Actinomycetes bacterium]
MVNPPNERTDSAVRDLDVVVVGGGIGGLTAAIALQRSGQRVRVLDQVRELRPVGAGISLWSNGVKVLDALGLGADVAAVGGRMHRMGYRDKHGTTLCEFSLAPLVERVGEHPYPVRRGDLQALLLGAIDGDVVRTGQRCTGVADDGEQATVTLESGEELAADLVIAADGTHSKLRDHVVGRPTERCYLGYHNWNGLVPDELALGDPNTWMMHVGDGRRVSTMPVRDGQYFFLDVPLADPTPSGGDPQEALRRHFEGWDPLVQRLIDGLDPTAVTNVSIHTHEPIDRFARGRVVLLGDSAHTTAPDLGQGGCMAMEDALVLAGYLQTTNVSVVDALQRYSDERVPRAADIVRRAADRARTSHAHDAAATEAWYEELRHTDGSDIIEGICKSIVTGPCR